MPATDGLTPPLPPREREILKSYGGWTNFCQSFGLKPWDSGDAEEGVAILRAFARDDDDEGGKAKN